MIYGYARVSTREQKLERQLVELLEFGITESNLFVDKQSGKDFDRTNYQKMKALLKQDDLLVIKSIDRLGRNYDAIIEEWANITKVIGCDIVVLDMDLLDTRTEARNLVGKFIADIVLQILSFVAENERANIRQRQAEGIRIAKEKGVIMGRPRHPIPQNFKEVALSYKHNNINYLEALRQTNLKRSTFYKLYKSVKSEL